jgi:hypothetical protein
MAPRKKIFLLLFVLSSVPLVLKAQEDNASRNKARQEARLKKAEDKAKRKHLSIQTKETRRRMKKHAQESRRVNENRPKFFWQNIFKKKKKK